LGKGTINFGGKLSYGVMGTVYSDIEKHPEIISKLK
jgi:hypothetical protein